MSTSTQLVKQSANPFAVEVSTPSQNALASSENHRAIAETQGAMVIAKQFPRDPVSAMDRILNACTRPTLAEGALYTYQRGGTDISGPSIRLAEAMAQNWGNLQFGIRELSQANGESTVEAFAWDVETNTRQVKVFQVRHERHTKKGVNKLSDPRDIYELVANQGARRLRACILGIIPGDVTEAAVKQCETTMVAKADCSPEAMKKMVAALGEFGVTKEQIEARIQRRIEAIQPAQVVSLRKIYTSIRDGISKPADWFGGVDINTVTATSNPIDPFAQAEPAPTPETVFEAAPTNRQQLALALADADVKEAAFIKALAKVAPDAVGKAKLVAELTEKAAGDALKDIDGLITSIE